MPIHANGAAQSAMDAFLDARSEALREADRHREELVSSIAEGRETAEPCYANLGDALRSEIRVSMLAEACDALEEDVDDTDDVIMDLAPDDLACRLEAIAEAMAGYVEGARAEADRPVAGRFSIEDGIRAERYAAMEECAAEVQALALGHAAAIREAIERATSPQGWAEIEADDSIELATTPADRIPLQIA